MLLMDGWKARGEQAGKVTRLTSMSQTQSKAAVMSELWREMALVPKI